MAADPSAGKIAGEDGDDPARYAASSSITPVNAARRARLVPLPYTASIAD
jgi:hypothetical protein